MTVREEGTTLLPEGGEDSILDLQGFAHLVLWDMEGIRKKTALNSSDNNLLDAHSPVLLVGVGHFIPSEQHGTSTYRIRAFVDQQPPLLNACIYPQPPIFVNLILDPLRGEQLSPCKRPINTIHVYHILACKNGDELTLEARDAYSANVEGGNDDQSVLSASHSTSEMPRNELSFTTTQVKVECDAKSHICKYFPSVARVLGLNSEDSGAIMDDVMVYLGPMRAWNNHD